MAHLWSVIKKLHESIHLKKGMKHMPSLQSLTRPLSGLHAAQRGLAVTGHNMANINTPGFSRQRANHGTFVSQTMRPGSVASGASGLGGTNIMQVGLGVDIMGIQQMRSQFLDSMFREEIGRAHFYERMHRNALNLEEIMGELSGTSSGITTQNRLWASIQELSLNPSNMDARRQFISAASSYLNRMNETHRNFIEQQHVLNDEVFELVNEVNHLLHRINELNQRIGFAETGTGQAANDYRDQRAAALDRLAAIIDIDYRIDPRTRGVEITTNGMELLAGTTVTHIGLRYTYPGSAFVEPVIGPGTRDGILEFDPTFRNAFSILRLDRPPTASDRPGQLMGVIMARGLHPANHASMGTVRHVYGFVEVAPPGTGNWNRIPPEFELAENGDWTEIGGVWVETPGTGTHNMTAEERFELSDPPGTGDYNLEESFIGNVTRDGIILTPRELSYIQARNRFNSMHTIIPRAMRELDILFNHTVTMLNEFLTNQNASTNRSTWGEELEDEDRTINASGGFGIPLFVVNDPSFIGPNTVNTDPSTSNNPDPLNQHNLNFTLGNVRINPELLTPNGHRYLGLLQNDIDIDDSTIIMNLLEAWRDSTVTLNNSASMNIDRFFNHLVINAATTTAIYADRHRGHLSAANEAEHRRLALSGVSLDEEATNMLKFQHAFNASSRILTVMDQMLETLLFRTGRVGL